MEYKAKIESWFKVTNPYGEICVMGYTYSDVRSCNTTTAFNNKHRIVTSKIVNLDNEKMELTTASGSIYKLGDPNSAEETRGIKA